MDVIPPISICCAHITVIPSSHLTCQCPPSCVSHICAPVASCLNRLTNKKPLKLDHVIDGSQHWCINQSPTGLDPPSALPTTSIHSQRGTEFSNTSKFIMSEEENDRLLVIGAGLGRTGTKSLKEALELLYHKPCYHMHELVNNHWDHAALWSKLFDMTERDPEVLLPEDVVRNIFNGYVATTDYPACTLYKQLMRIYPEAKVILTVRDPNKWIQSIRETIIRKRSFLEEHVIGRFRKIFSALSGFPNMGNKMIKQSIGSNVDLNSDEQVIQGFINWNNQVKRMVPDDRLLVFDVTEGWEPLCHFLKKPIPNVPFPHVNDRESMRSRMKARHRRLMCRLTSGLLVIGVVALIGIVWSKRRSA